MNTTQRIKMGLLLARLKLGAIFTTDKSYPKDPNPKNWRTINHAKVHLSNGKIDGGAGGKFQSNAWVGKEKHGNNSFFPLNQMYYGKKAQTNAKSAEVSSQAGAAGASQAKQAAKAASKSKAASAVAEGQTSAIAAMQEYMQQKKAAQQTPPEEAVPFGSPDLEPPKPDGKLPIYHINSLKGTFKNLDADIQDEVKQIIKYAKTNGDVPAWSADAFTDADYDLAMKTVEALKTKNITPTAAQNIMGALYANQKNYLTNLIHKNWPDTLPDKPETQKPKTAKATSNANGLYEAQKKAADLVKKMDNTSGISSKVFALIKEDIPPGKASEIYEWYDMDKKNGTTKAQEALTEFLYKNSLESTGWPDGYKFPKGTQELFETYHIDQSDFSQKAAKANEKLTQKQKDAILRYTQGSKHLRNWLVYGKTDEHYKDHYYSKGMTGEAMQKAADDISAALKKTPHPTMLVERKCSLKDWATPENKNGATFESLQKMAETRETFEFKAFLSTTPVKGGTYGEDDDTMRHILVPKKAPGGYIKSISEYGHEKEFLLDKKTKTRIIKVEKDKSGIIHVYEEVVV